MAISPYDGEAQIANEIRRIYSEAELRTIEAIANSLRRGNPDAPRWAAAKMRDLQRVKGKINKDVIAYLKNANPKVEAAIEKAYKKGQLSAEADLRKADDLKVAGKFGASDQAAVRALASETVSKLNSTHLRILRSADDVYRRAVAEATSGVITGTRTRREAAQKVLNTFANKGVTGFIDKSGRSWNLPSYAEMATRTSSGRAAIDGHLNRAQDNDRDLVIVSDHAGECPLCRSWERRVLSISGESDKYPSMSDARSAGLFHPSCRHTVNVYTKGLTEDVGNKKADSSPDNYKARQKSRYNERGVRKWKRRKAGAITEQERVKAKSKVSEWQKKQREHIDKNKSLRRKYEREQIDQAR